MIKHIINYFNATVLISVLSFISLPFFTRYLTPEDFGVLSIYFMFGNISASFLSLGLQGATIRYYYKLKNDLNHFGKLNFTNFSFIILIFIIAGFSLKYFSSIISIRLFASKVSPEIITLAYVGGCLTYLFTYLRELLIPREDSKTFAFISIFYSVITLSLGIFFVLYYSMTYYARIYGIIISDIIFILILLFIHYKYFSLQWSFKTLKKSLIFSYPQIPLQLINIIQRSFDKTMLTNISGLNNVGYYQIAQNFGEISKRVFSTITRAWSPYFFNKAELNNDESKDKIVKRYLDIVVLYCCFCFLLCCFAEESVIILTTEAFYPSMYIIPLIVLYILIIHIILSISKPQIIFSEKVIYTLPPTIIAVIVNIILNLIFIPIYGAIGAALATLIANLCSSIMLYFFGQRLYPLPINIKKIIQPVLMLVIFLIPIYLLMLSDIFFLLKFFIKILLLISFFYLSIKLKFINKDKFFQMIPLINK